MLVHNGSVTQKVEQVNGGKSNEGWVTTTEVP